MGVVFFQKQGGNEIYIFDLNEKIVFPHSNINITNEEKRKFSEYIYYERL